MTVSRRVLYLQYTNPAGYPPVEHGAHMLAESGFDVMLLGIANFSHNLSLRAHERIHVRLMRYQPPGWLQKVHYAWFCIWVLMWTLRWRPAWIYASDPLSCPVTLVLNRVLGLRVVYHEHDAPFLADADIPQSRVTQYMLRMRAAVARRADVCVLPNAGRASHFSRETGRENVVVVWNCPSRQDIPERSATTSSALRVWYHGTIVPARVPPAVIEALASLPDQVSLTIAGYETAGHVGYARELTMLAHRHHVAHRFEIRGPQSHRNLLRQCAGCDVGLALLPLASADLNAREMVGASNKAFDYMASGLALLVPDSTDWRAMYVDGGYGRCCDPQSAESIAGELRWFLQHPLEVREMGDRGRRQIQDHWNYERAFAPVFAQLAGVAFDHHAHTRAEVVG